ncbi:MAG: hypothetical protein P9M00_02630 [Candidatus Tritonobacter lacicola]|nr:hypothetical protein [Candidatus Tritonobacter lacicola]
MNTTSTNSKDRGSLLKSSCSRISPPGMPGAWFQRETQLALLIFILNALLLFPVFFPTMGYIGMFDEAVDINSGRHLAEGNLPMYACKPLVALLYTITYLPVQNSPYWLIHSCGIGRFALFCLLWWSAYLVARQLKPPSSPLVAAALLSVSPIIVNLLHIPSHALFAGLSALAFWQVLSFYNSKEIKHLWIASILIALVALSRNEGILLFLNLILISILLSTSIKRMVISVIACILPIALIVGGYILLHGFITGTFEIGVTGRAYTAFEQGQAVAFSHLEKENPFIEGQFQARELFGDPEENQCSIITAIRRNPNAFLRRILQITMGAPLRAINIYGAGIGLILVLLAARGIIELIIKRMYLLLCIVLLWPAYLLVYFLTLFNAEYFLLLYFLVVSLASAGLISTVARLGNPGERYSWSAILIGLASAGIIGRRPSLFAASLVFLLGLWIIWFIRSRYRNPGQVEVTALVVALYLALLMRGDYPWPVFRELGTHADEKAALFMMEQLEPGARVGAYAPGNVWITKMNYVPMYRDLRYISTDKDLLDWMKEQDLEAIYVDKALRDYESSLWALIERQIGTNLEVAFTCDDSAVQVLLVTTKR